MATINRSRFKEGYSLERIWARYPLIGKGTQADKLRMDNGGLASGETWVWNGTAFAATAVGGGGGAWGDITGTLADQTDLNTALGLKLNTSAFVPAGSNTQIQFNNSSAFGASANLTWSGSVLGVTGRVEARGAGTGIIEARNTNFGGGDESTVRLTHDVAGSYNFHSSIVSTLPGDSTTSLLFRTSGASATLTTKASITGHGMFSILPTSSAATGLKVNAPTGFTGGLIDLQINGVSHFTIDNTYASFLDGVRPYLTSGIRTETAFDIYQPVNIGGSNYAMGLNSGTLNGGAGAVQQILNLTYTVNQTSTASYTGIYLNVTETSLGSGGGNLMNLLVAGSSKFLVTNSGNVVASTAHIAPMFRNTANDFHIYGDGNGIIGLYDNTETTFNRLQFGGSGTSHPALKRNGTTLEVKLANDSAFTAIQSLYIRFGAGDPNSVVTAPVGAIYSRTDGGAGSSLYVKESGTGNTGWVAK